MQNNENTAITVQKQNQTPAATVVSGVNLIPLVYNGVRVIMSEQLAELYDTTSKIISYNFNSNKNKYVAGIHFFCLAVMK